MSSVAAALKSSSDGGYAQPFWRQLVECTSKALGSYWKSPAYNLLRLLMTAACALIYGTMWVLLMVVFTLLHVPKGTWGTRRQRCWLLYSHVDCYWA